MSDAHASQDDETELALAEALAAAVRPEAIDPKRHASVLTAAFAAHGDATHPLAPPSPEERMAASRLARALEHGSNDAGAALLRDLAAITPGADAATSGAASERALRRALDQVPARPARSNVVFAWFGGAAAVLAAAAAVSLVIGDPEPAGRTRSRTAFAESRSAAPLFAEQLAAGAELSASARIDRIASVRARELRDNRYLAWGVR